MVLMSHDDFEWNGLMFSLSNIDMKEDEQFADMEVFLIAVFWFVKTYYLG